MMKVLANEVIPVLKEVTFPTKNFEIKKVTLKKADGSGITPVFDFLKTSLKDHAISEAVIQVNKDVIVKIQSNIVNLPLAYPAQLEKLTEGEQSYDVNIYAVFEAEAINSSHLRIDQIGTADDLLGDDADLKANFKDWLLKQFDQLDN
jgi:hypothetical protein